MSIIDKNTGLYTDLYQLTMAQGYFKQGVHEKKAAFDYFFRKIPFGGNYVIFSGIDDVVELLEKLRFEEEDLAFLRKYNFDEGFLDYLKKFSFKGHVHSIRQGEAVFPNLPLVRVEGSIVECQLIETLLLNILNFSTLITTKAARMREAAGDEIILMDFGMRRAHGSGSIFASKAAIEGGFNATSHVKAALDYNIPATGTMAHSWIQAFHYELEAFRYFAQSAPVQPVLLVDTYDTLNSGIPNAIKISKELKAEGRELAGIRLDSGDIKSLSFKARKMLDEAGLKEVKIAASDKVDEYFIEKMREAKAPIDAYGIGTRLVTGQPDANLDGVFKLAYFDSEPRLKVSDDPEKTTLPGLKQLGRFKNPENGEAVGDVAMLEDEEKPRYARDIKDYYDNRDFEGYAFEKLLKPVMQNGERVTTFDYPAEVSAYSRERIHSLPPKIQSLLRKPTAYFAGMSNALQEMRADLIKNSP